MIRQSYLDVPANLIDHILELVTHHPGVKFSNQGGWHSEPFYQVPEEYQSWINKVVNFVGQDLNSFWFNINGPGHRNKWHDHGQKFKSIAVWYLQTPTNSGNFEYKLNNSIESLEPSRGLIITHPGGIQHCVTENLSTELRISIAFNFL